MKSTKSVRVWSLIVALAAAVGSATCGQIESSPTAPTDVTPSPTPSPTPTPAPAAPPAATNGHLSVQIVPNPVPFSGKPITDVASCANRNNTWYYDQVLKETGGVAITISEKFDIFDGVGGSASNPNLQIPANGTVTLHSRWCSSSSSAHTAQTNFKGTDAKGNFVSLNGPVVQLQAAK